MQGKFLGWKKDNGDEGDEEYTSSTGLPRWEYGKLICVEHLPRADPELPYREAEEKIYLRANEIEIVPSKPFVAEDWL